MPFPFIAPLKDWVITKLEKKEANPQSSILRSPFAMLTSGAVVLKGKTPDEIKNFFKSQQYGPDAYYGCVLTNTTDASKLYQTGNTIVGYDLNGKEIVVEGEKNRRTSPPIIESIEIDTSGGNNTLKVAEIKIKVFTLKQLEMFELFFLRPSMNVVLEYGWNTDIRGGVTTGNTLIQKNLFANKDFKKYKEDYVNLFLDKTTINDYTRILKETDGNYDFMIGRVTNFTYTPNVDGTYDINLQVSAGNELQLWPAYRAARTSSNVDIKNKNAGKTYKAFIEKIAADLKVEQFKTIFAKEADWKTEFFNYGITNEKQGNTIVSKTPYISFKAIIEIINNYKILVGPNEGIYPAYKFGKDDLIPVTSNPYIISTNPYILIPGSLPNIKVQTNGTENRIVVSTDDKERQDCKINGKSFNLNNTKIYDFPTGKPILNVAKIEIESKIQTGKKISVFSNTGNLLNIFFSYERFLEIIDVATSLTEIITPILSAINDTMLGLCDLQIQVIGDGPSNRRLEIVDRKIQHPEESIVSNKPTYRFKVGTTGILENGKPYASIVKNFTFNMEMSTLMQAQALYSLQLAIAKQNKKITTDASSEIDDFVSADLSYAKNADGYFSINDMEISIIKDERTPKSPEKTPEQQKEEKEQLEEVKISKYTKFIINGKVKNLVYQDIGLIQLYLQPKANSKSLALSYLNITLGIEGTAGFSCGEYFNIEGIPEIYNRNGYFQILNVKQGIDESGWKTTIEAGFLIKTE
jgi:hypothetical protein